MSLFPLFILPENNFGLGGGFSSSTLFGGDDDHFEEKTSLAKKKKTTDPEKKREEARVTCGAGVVIKNVLPFLSFIE